MPQPPSKSQSRTPLPRNHLIFDPWNTGSAGHECAQHSYVTRTAEFRSVRTQQLARQFRGVTTKPVSEIAPLEMKEKDDEKGRRTRQRRKGEGDIREYMGGQSKFIISGCPTATNSKKREELLVGQDKAEPEPDKNPPSHPSPPPPPPPPPPPTTTIAPSVKAETTTTSSSRKIFHSLTFFINGSTFPLISDHKLRHLVAEHGGAISISLARRSVTHVIIAAPSSLSSSSSSSSSARAGARCAGGGLSAAKLQKEIVTTAGKGKGKGVKFVGVEWIIECVKAGKRLPEARFVVSLEKNKNSNALVGASRGQRSVYGMFKGASG
ncbi:hypothetical protein PISL3812_07509 [Talaromyces islandicus]|uniref:BRCT domain-containing protein n=1 Tax=Talaromyces islandicus TaxID=28573 RepID=A0A0U1M4L4_TALIS|nr:hypothetical protein PISL3812_07509 [Talaromyces islandicus]